mgnify:CR=1 FL=1|jgi:acetyltransferase-like isoleucine patch superfamily enzyme
MSVFLRKIGNLIKMILLYKIFRYWVILNVISVKIKPGILKLCGAKIGLGCYFANGIYIDNNLKQLKIGDNILVGPNVQFLFHYRDMSSYCREFKNKDLKHVRLPIEIGDGVSIGMGAIIMPGVKIGNGAVIGAGTLVNKSVPEWSLAIGNPMKIVKQYE